MKIFIGGFGGSGTRVISEILKTGGYYVGEPYINKVYDYLGVMESEVYEKYWFVPVFNEFYFNNNEELLKELLSFKNIDNWAIKHGHLMFIIDKLKEWHPDSKFIYVYRNPIDNMLNGYETHHIYGGLRKNASIRNKVEYHIEESKKAISKSDLTVKLEDLCFNTSETIKKVLEFAGLETNNIEHYSKIINIPESIGRGIRFYHRIDCSELGYSFMEEKINKEDWYKILKNGK